MPDALSLLVWGRPKTGKTTLALSFPGPTHIFDFDFGVNELTNPYDGPPPAWATAHAPDVVQREYNGYTLFLHPMQYKGLEPTMSDRRDLLNKFETRFLKMLNGEIPCATLVVDTDSQWWTLVSSVKREQSRAEREISLRRTRGQNYVAEATRLDYGLANQYRENTILAAKQRGVNFILVERAKEVWGTDAEGKNPQPTGQFAPRGQGDTDALVQMVLRTEVVNLAGRETYQAVIEESRFKRVPRGLAIPDLTYSTLAQMLWPARKEVPVVH